MKSNNKIALVTGGSRGLGKDMALRLAASGIDVIITYLTKEAEAQAVVADIRQQGHRAASLPLNTGDVKRFPDFITSLQATLAKDFGTDRIDFLVNNAGIGGYSPVPDVTEAFLTSC
ncbi:SDR family NAD(P)-dependent oxidoreductase [Chitinophaga sedimenti]|uniref:SDR family NAD(P)-dependent oxidoreductase n=1 Tax=Chitinophaga sedimenti TaxID=2033606 RepID=UPI0027E1F853|nr:SDR family NAD(P)-dependent oxidoreductase [Chitinophaga sedimenti]